MDAVEKTKARLWSLDTLRGFDMFWIIGGDAFAQALAKVTGWAGVLAAQLEHAEWQGFHFYDLIFPLFMFISGVAIPYSLLARAEGGADKRGLYPKLVRRALLLVALGFVYNRLLDLDLQGQRYPSVLGQIGLAYLFAALIMLNVRTFKGRLAAPEMDVFLPGHRPELDHHLPRQPDGRFRGHEQVPFRRAGPGRGRRERSHRY